MDMPGGFLSMLCRCGKELCKTHPDGDAKGRVVLPPTVEPVHYDLKLHLFLEQHRFDGEVTVKVSVKAPVKEIALHAKELAFTGAECDGVAAKSVLVDFGETTVTVAFEDALTVGEHSLRLTYGGILNADMAGFYRSTYTDINGDKKLMASTQFESIDARRCFPCWDEPRRKATFACTLRCPAHMTALSNMPETRTLAHGDGSRTTVFDATPKMSTYLLAFVVGEFDHVAATTKHGVLIRCWTPPGKPELGEFALDCAVKALDAYDEKFRIPYPLPKSDMVAIPEFAAGAMENWGLVTYREVDMLVDAKTAASRQLQRVAEVVIHELAHQWFGNLVTMEWWEDLWLNEGFATWMETGVCADLYPEWSMWEQFITDMQGRALSLDALRSSHPIQVPIARAEEVEQVFDAISYCKGGAVVRMAHALVGEKRFVEGLRAYMAEFSYGNATTADLWAAWEKASGEPVSKIMDAWTTQVGFPLLELVSANADGTLDLAQRRFFADGKTATGADAALWPVPLFATTAGAKEATLGRMPAAATFTTTSKLPAGDRAWVKLNAGQHAPLRVKYPDAMMPALCGAVASRAMPAADRIGFLSDCAALSRAGLLDFGLYLEVLGAYRNETEATVWSQVLGQLASLGRILKGGGPACEPTAEAFFAFARGVLAPLLERVGWAVRDEDGHLTKQLRGEVLASLPTFFAEDAAVLAEAKRRFDAFRGGDSAALPAEYQAAVYKLVVAADAANFAHVRALYDTLELNEERKQCLVGLGAAPTPALRDRALRLALSGDVKLQDFFYVSLAMHGASAAGRDHTWAFFRGNFGEYVAKVGDAGSSLMDASISGGCSGYASAAKADEIEAFFAENPLPRSARKIAQITEATRAAGAYVDTILASKTALPWLEKANA